MATPSPSKPRSRPRLSSTGADGRPQNVYLSPETIPTASPYVSSATSSLALRQSIAKGWPAKKQSHQKNVLNLTITRSDVYRTQTNGADPAKLFAKAERFLTAIEHSPNNDATAETINKQLQEAMARVVFGGNQIERVGLGLDETLKICRRILAGDDVANIDERTPEYLAKLAEFHGNSPNGDFKTMPIKGFLRGRREVVQHARAFQLMIHWVVILDLPFSEQMIKDTHRVLCDGTPIPPDEDGIETPWEDYAGRYRQVHVGAGATMFTPPQFVKKQMGDLVHDLNTELDEALAKGALDPFAFAAKYSMRFVQVHPFQDGNGRVCRMILNSLLCKFTGIVVPIGETKQDQEEYICIKRTASEDAADHGEYATFVLAKAESRLRAIKKKLTVLGKN